MSCQSDVVEHASRSIVSELLFETFRFVTDVTQRPAPQGRQRQVQVSYELMIYFYSGIPVIEA